MSMLKTDMEIKNKTFPAVLRSKNFKEMDSYINMKTWKDSKMSVVDLNKYRAGLPKKSRSILPLLVTGLALFLIVFCPVIILVVV